MSMKASLLGSAVPLQDTDYFYVARPGAPGLPKNITWAGLKAAVANISTAFMPERYAAAKASGVVGDGTDDGPAFVAMCAAINALGGGVAVKLDGVYFTGSTVLHNPSTPGLSDGSYNTLLRWHPLAESMLNFKNCTKPIVVYSNAAVIRGLAGLKYGTFDVAGAPMVVATNYSGDGVAIPYVAMVNLENCSGRILFLGDLELDGNIKNATIGGWWASDASGRQIPASGFRMKDCPNVQIVGSIRSHHHGLDGGLGSTASGLAARDDVVLRGLICEYNGRQGWSQVGGNGWTYEDSKFRYTGRDLGATMTYSQPGGGFDLESEEANNNDTKWHRCDFVDNAGAGFISDGDTNPHSPGNDFYDCLFIGTTNFPAWPNQRFTRFHNSKFVGSVVRPCISNEPSEATKFYDCDFTDDPAESPTGAVYGAAGIAGMNDAGATNVYLENCRHYISAGGSIGAYSGPPYGPFYDDCTFINGTASAANLNVYGIFTGIRTSFVDCQTFPGQFNDCPWVGSGIVDPMIGYDRFWWSFNKFGIGPFANAQYNPSYDRESGKKLFHGSAVYDPPSLALGASAAIQTFAVAGVAVGDLVRSVSFTNDLAGARVTAWVSAANTVSYYFTNENGANPLDLANGTVTVVIRQR